MKNIVTSLFILLVIISSAGAEEPALAPTICVLSSNNDCACGLPPDNVLTVDKPEIYVKAAINANERGRIEFMWFRPDGTMARRSIKPTLLNTKDGRYDAWDSIQHKGIEGWWRVEAEYPDGKLSKEFLVTKSRQVITLLTGDKYAKFETIKKVDPSGREGRDIIDVALQDPSWEIRAAALERLGGVSEQWAMHDVREGLYDTDSRVRLAALGEAGILGTSEKRTAYLDALSSSEPQIRLAGIKGLYGYDDDAVRGALMEELQDKAAENRLAALERLAEIKAPGLDAHLKSLVADEDHDVALKAEDVVAGLADSPGRTGALVQAALSVHTDVSRRALDELLETGGAAALPALIRHYREGYRMEDDLRAIVSVRTDDAVGYIKDAYKFSGSNEPLRLAAVKGLSGRGTEAVEVVEEAARDRSAAVRIAALEAARTLPVWPGRTAMLRKALADADLSVSSRALDMLSETGTPEAYDAMMDALDNPRLCETALKRVTGSGLPGVIQQLAKRGLTVEDVPFRCRIVGSLAEYLKDVSAYVPYLRDEEPAVRATAAKTIGKVGGADAAYELYLAGKDTAPAVRVAAVDALRGMPEHDLAGGLSVLNDKGGLDAATAGFIADAVEDPDILGMLVKIIPAQDTAMLEAALGPIISHGGDAVIPALIEGLKTSDTGLAGMLASRLCRSASPAAVEALEGAYKTRPEFREMLLAKTAGSPVSKDITGLALSDGDAAIRKKAVEGLSGHDKGFALASLLSAVKDKDSGVRLASCSVAVRLGLTDVLMAASGDSDAAVREASAKGLTVLGGPDAEETLAMLAMDKEHSVADAAVSGLAAMRGKVSLRTWVKIAGGPATNHARIAAFGELGKTGRKEAAGVLAGAMAEDDQQIADAAESAMAALGRVALGDVYPLLNSGNTRTRALRILERVPDPASEPYILTALPGLEGRDKVDAINALGMLGGRKSLVALAGMYKGADEGLRVTILRAVAGLDLKGDEPELVNMLSDALGSAAEDVRFYAVRAAGSTHASALKDRLMAMQDSENSALVKRELANALGSI